MKYLEEAVVIGGTIVAVTLAIQQQYELALAAFTGVLGYATGRTQKINGALKEINSAIELRTKKK